VAGGALLEVRGRSADDRKTVETFLDELGEERCKQIGLVSCDMAAWIAGPVAGRLPHAARCVDPFHVIKLATDALDEVRREVWNEARRAGYSQLARNLKGARFALWKNPREPDRPSADQARLDRAAQPAVVLRLPAQGATAPDLPAPRRRCDRAARQLDQVGQALPPRSIREARAHDHRPARAGIIAAIEHDLSNARVEAINTQIRLITRRAYGFHTAQALIALAMLTFAGLCPPLPDRVT
jgi:transposase